MKHLNFIERSIDWATRGKYRKYTDSPLIQMCKEISESSRKSLHDIYYFEKKLNDLTNKNKIAVNELIQKLINDELKKYPIDRLIEVPGIGKARLNSIKKRRIKTLEDIHTKPELLFETKGLTDNSRLEIGRYLRATIADIKQYLSPPRLKDKQEQELLSNLLYHHDMQEREAPCKKHKERLKKISDKVKPISFFKIIISPESLEANLPYKEKVKLSEVRRWISTLPESDSYSFDCLKTNDYIRGVSLLTEALRNASGARLEKASTHKISDGLLKKIEALKLNTGHIKGCILRRYQEFGSKFIIVNKHVAIGDEMGLGKTIQILACLSHLYDSKETFRALVIVPASISGNWLKEITSKTDLPSFLVVGSKRRIEFFDWKINGGIAITSYSTFRNDLHYYSDLEQLDMLVADEAQYIKNPDAARAQAVKYMLPKAEYAVVMTGTPVENHPGNFIHILNCLSHEIKELKKWGNGSQWPTPEKFKSLAGSIYLRRNKDDVLTELPELIDTVEWVPLSNEEMHMHLRQMKDETHIMQLRQEVTLLLDEKSAKMQRIFQIAESYFEDKKNIVIFTFFKEVIELLMKQFPHAKKIDGSVKSSDRMRLIDEFTNNPNGGQVIVGQINAAGVGLNMQAAQGVILVEPQFNPAIEYQAICRVHRMGQRSSVNVHRIIAQNSVEESILELLKKKRAYMDDYGKDSELKELSADAISTKDATALVKRSIEMIEDKLQRN